MQLSNNYSREFFSNIKVIGFDFDNTLVDEEYFILKRWRKTLNKFRNLSPKLFDTFLEIYSTKGPNYKYHVNDVLSSLGIDSMYLHKIMEKFMTVEAAEKTYPSVKLALNFLSSKKLKLGIITNGNRRYQEPRIKSAGISKYMNFIYYGDSDKKAEKQIFLKCMKRFGLADPKQFLFVGDDYLFDINSVLSLGSKACWINNVKNSNKKNNSLQTFESFSSLYSEMRKAMR